MTFRRAAASAALLSVFAATDMPAQQRRPVTASDCVTTKYLLDGWHHSPIKINPQGTLVAYLVKSPNLQTNRNDIELYVRAVANPPDNSPRLLLKGTDISHIEWAGGGRRIIAQARIGLHIAVESIDVTTANQTVLAQMDRDIVEYTVDERASIVIFAVEDDAGNSIKTPSSQEAARGYRIPFEQSAHIGSSRQIFLARSTKSGNWTKPLQIGIQSPVTGQRVNNFDYQLDLRLSLSPDGRSLLFQYIVGEAIPDDWKRSPFVQTLFDRYGLAGQLTVLYDVTNGNTTVAFKSLYTLNVPLWSADSGSFLVAAYPPVDSPWWPQESPNPVIFSDLYDLFCVRPSTGQVELVKSHLPSVQEQPLFWGRDNHVLLYSGRGSVEDLYQDGGNWYERTAFDIPTPQPLRQARLTTDGKHFIGEYQDIETPPELFEYERGDRSVKIVSKLNPQMRDLAFAKVQTVRWKTSSGYSIQGVLFTPPNFVLGTEYPLVIQTKPYYGQFVCDTGESHYPSFAPQPLAASGIMYLARGSSLPDDNWNEANDVAHYPVDYPGGIGEAAFNMDVWDSAVVALQSLGYVDPDKVGIIGFSRSGWYTEFALAHGRTRYKAATVADNVEYSLSEYWALHSASYAQAWESMYGGPPSGRTLTNWLNYSISFNLENIHTPILMEEMGSGVPYRDSQAIPINLVNHFDVFTGLSRLNKPVVLYYYPDEDHTPEDPQARLGSLQRNVDWYRFWLQGAERMHPEDADQYMTWRYLRDLAHRDARIGSTER